MQRKLRKQIRSTLLALAMLLSLLPSTALAVEGEDTLNTNVSSTSETTDGTQQNSEDTINSAEKLEAALADAGDGDVIELADGIYEFDSNLKIESAVTINGNGQTLKFNVGNLYYTGSDDSNLVLNDLTIDVSGSTSNMAVTYGGQNSKDNLTVTLNDCTLVGNGKNTHGVSIQTVGTGHKLVLDGTAFDNMYCALGLADQDGAGKYLGTKVEGVETATFNKCTYSFQLFYPAENSYFETYEDNIVHHALRTAVENGLLPVNPADGVIPPKIVRGTKSILNQEQLDRFKAAVKQDWGWRDFFLTELTTGLRRGELCGLKWSDFDEEAGTLKVCRTIHAKKGGEMEEGSTKTYAGTRTILLPSSTAQLLRERKKSALTEWIFPDLLCPEKPVSPGSAYRRLKGLLEEAGLPDLRFHDLRHTFATHALASGVDAKTLSGILGHTKASFTLDTYTHVTGDMHRNAAEIVGDFMTELLGEEMEPWQSSESGETAVST